MPRANTLTLWSKGGALLWVACALHNSVDWMFMPTRHGRYVMETLVGILMDTYQTTSTAVFAHAPRFLATLLVVLAGLIVARLAKSIVLTILEALRLEDLSTRIGATAALKRADVGLSISEIAATLVYWTFLVFTATAALSALGMADVSTFAPVAAMVPGVIVASAILVLGLNLSGFVSKLIQTAAVNAEVRQARIARNVAHYGMNGLVVVLALRQLGVPDALMSQGFLILLASVGAALALAFGLGARDLANGIATSSWKYERAQSHALAEASNLGREVIPGATVSAPPRVARGRAATTA